MSKKNTVFVILIFVCFTLFYLFRGDYGIVPNFANDVFTVDGPQGIYFSVDFDDIARLELAGKEFDKGTRLSGATRYGYEFGEYENTALGRYELCKTARVNYYIIAAAKDGRTLVFSADNDETTQNLHRELTAYMLEKGYQFVN